MQTILGAGGITATEIARELPRFTKNIRLVSRHPQKVNSTDELMTADLLFPQQVSDAVRGSETVYLTAGFPYKKKIWQQQWPVVMRNVIEACKKHSARLVFFDNVYMYGRVTGPMTEDTPYKPSSMKGQIRAEIATSILQEVQKGNLVALIARAPEFYGPRKTMSVVNAMVFDNIRKGKKLQWVLNDSFLRTWIYTPDAGRATALLGNTSDAFNQTWHLPCPDRQMNGKEFISLTSSIYGKELKYTVLSKWMIRMAGMFNFYARELVEMLYQFEQDYIFDSSKFKKRFSDFKVTEYRDGIAEILKDISAQTKPAPGLAP